MRRAAFWALLIVLGLLADSALGGLFDSVLRLKIKAQPKNRLKPSFEPIFILVDDDSPGTSTQRPTPREKAASPVAAEESSAEAAHPDADDDVESLIAQALTQTDLEHRADPVIVVQEPTQKVPIAEQQWQSFQSSEEGLRICTDETACRHTFLRDKISVMFDEGRARERYGEPLVNWATFLKRDFGLGVDNVVMQSGTAVWLYGCRPTQMTNDVDAWLLPVPATNLEFKPRLRDNTKWKFWWKLDATNRWKRPFWIEFLRQPEQQTTILQQLTSKPQADGSMKTKWKNFELVTTGPVINPGLNLARVEFMRDGEIIFYGTSADTKHALYRVPPSQDPTNGALFELDLYTPFGALDGNYRWPWEQTAQYLSGRPKPENELAVIPKHVAIVQKLKLYFDCDIDSAQSLPHRIKKSNEPIKEFFEKNFNKMAQDIDDMNCLCGLCHAQREEPCVSLCSVVEVIVGEYAPSLLPGKYTLYSKYQKAVKAQDPASPDGMQVNHDALPAQLPEPERISRLQTLQPTLAKFLGILKGDWKEETLIKNLEAKLERLTSTNLAGLEEQWHWRGEGQVHGLTHHRPGMPSYKAHPHSVQAELAELEHDLRAAFHLSH